MKTQTLAEWLNDSGNNKLITKFESVDRMTKITETDFKNIMEMMGLNYEYEDPISMENVVAINKKTNRMHNRFSKRS
jgi:hypothetical protein